MAMRSRPRGLQRLTMAKKHSTLKDKVLLLIAQSCCLMIAFFAHGRCSFHLLGDYPEEITFLSPQTIMMDIANVVIVVKMCLFFVLCFLDLRSNNEILSPSMQGWGSLSSLLSAMTISFISMHPKSLPIWAATSFFGLLNLGLGLEQLYRGCGLRALSDDYIRSCDRSRGTEWVLYLFGVSLSITKAWFIVLINICLIHTCREAIQVCQSASRPH